MRLRAGELIGREVTDAAGHALGRVEDLRAERDEAGRYRVCELIVGRRALAGRLGYGETLRIGPPFSWVLHALRRHEHPIPWEQVAALDDDGRVRLHPEAPRSPEDRSP
ncbi:MAG: hypothetical protein GEV11_14315 [Streptosporangiales bacterium]|nr:hypothetical protein [Streptosporangiales bacterium]